MSMTSGIKTPSTKKKNVPIERRLVMVRAQLEDLQDYLELLEARMENKGKPRYSLEEAKRKLQL
jgi:LytS/YehU family sensor histidine kinase